MGEKYLIDSNSVVDYLGKKLPDSGMVFMNPIIDAVGNISVITKIQVLGFRMTENEHEKLLEDFMHDAVVLALNDLVIDKTIQIRREHKIKLPGAIIAATALVYDFTLITRAHLKNTFWEFSASLPILLRWLSCPDSLWYELRKPPCIMAKYLKISSKLIFEMGSSNTTDFTDICKVINPWNQ